MNEYKWYVVILKGGKEQVICAKSAREAVEKVKKLLPSKEVVGYSEAEMRSL